MIFSNIAIAGNEFGVKQSFNIIPRELIKCLIAPSIRPHLIEPIQKFSQSKNISFLTQPRFGSEEYALFFGKIVALKIDLLITNNYAMIIRPDLLSVLKGNAINVHWALLPMNRGCNPVNWPIIKGENRSGVTLHYIDEGLDSGDIIAQQEVPIFFEDTWVSLKNRLSGVSENFLQESLINFIQGNIRRIKQDESIATFNDRLYPNSPRIDFERMSDLNIYNLIRGQVTPLQGAFVESGGKKIYFNDFVPFESIKLLREKYSKKTHDSIK